MQGSGSLGFAKSCLMKFEVYFVCHFIVLFFLTLWKVICWIKCKLSFPDNWSSYIVNVILLLKGFYSMLCANGCPFPWRCRTMELFHCNLIFSPGPGLSHPKEVCGLEGRFERLESPYLSALKRAGLKLSNLTLLHPNISLRSLSLEHKPAWRQTPIHIKEERKWQLYMFCDLPGTLPAKAEVSPTLVCSSWATTERLSSILTAAKDPGSLNAVGLSQIKNHLPIHLLHNI